MKVNWVSCKEKLPETAGDYLVVYPVDSDACLDAEVSCFYRKGDVLTCAEPQAGRTAEERLLDSVLNRTIRAEKDGFYFVGEDFSEFWGLKPLFWAELPEAPEGCGYRTF